MPVNFEATFIHLGHLLDETESEPGRFKHRLPLLKELEQMLDDIRQPGQLSVVQKRVACAAMMDMLEKICRLDRGQPVKNQIQVSFAAVDVFDRMQRGDWQSFDSLAAQPGLNAF